MGVLFINLRRFSPDFNAVWLSVTGNMVLMQSESNNVSQMLILSLVYTKHANRLKTKTSKGFPNTN